MPEPFDAESWRRWKEFFDLAADLPPDQQEDLLDRHFGGEPELRGRFSSMLAAHRRSSAMLDRSLPERFLAISGGSGGSPPPPAQLAAGELLKSRYRIESIVGQGGLSVVYLARDEQMHGRHVVVKLLNRQHEGDSGLEDELAALSQLYHPGIAAPLDSGAAPDGRHFLVLAYVPGLTLRATLEQEGAFDAARVVRLLRAMGSALEAAHAEGVCHLDLKPENILLQTYLDEETPVIVDFGISRLLHSPGRGAASPAGSLAYIPPEQLNGNPSEASDQYSLALVAAEMLTGRRPAPLVPVARILQRCGHLPPRARRALSRALSAAPRDRYPEIGSFVAEFTTALDPQRLRRRRFGALAAAVAVIALTAGIYSYWQNRREEQRMIASNMNVISSQLGTWVRMADRSPFPPGALEEAFETPLANLRRMVREGHREPELLLALSDSLALYGTYLGHPSRRNVGQTERGIAALRESIEVGEMLGKVTPNPQWWRSFSADRHDLLASVLVEAGEFEQAERVARQGLALLALLPGDGAAAQVASRPRSALLLTLSRIHHNRGEFAECLRLRDEGLRIRRAIVPMQNNSRPARYDVAVYLASRGQLLRDMGRLDESERDHLESEAIVAPLLREEPWNLQYRWLHVRNGMRLGRLLLLRGQHRPAHTRLADSVQEMRGLLEASRHEVSSLRSYALGLSWLSVAEFHLGASRRTVLALVTEALEVNQSALDLEPLGASIRVEREWILANARETGVHIPDRKLQPSAR